MPTRFVLMATALFILACGGPSSAPQASPSPIASSSPGTVGPARPEVSPTAAAPATPTLQPAGVQGDLDTPPPTGGLYVIDLSSRRWYRVADPVGGFRVDASTRSLLGEPSGTVVAELDKLLGRVVDLFSGSSGRPNGPWPSPDGLLIASRTREGLFVSEASSGRTRFVVSNVGDFASWSADGSMLAFNGDQCLSPGWEPMVIRADGSGFRRLVTDPIQSPPMAHVWSADGGTIVQSWGSLVEIDVNDGSARQLAAGFRLVDKIVFAAPDVLVANVLWGAGFCESGSDAPPFAPSEVILTR